MEHGALVGSARGKTVVTLLLLRSSGGGRDETGRDGAGEGPREDEGAADRYVKAAECMGCARHRAP